MSLAAGHDLSHYHVTASLGAGGMGEVYRATDTKLGRDVAIKVLPAEVAQDPERLARFEREAKVLASLNHTGIAHVYGFESTTLPDGSTAHFLAMELVEGEDLSERLKRGAIPVDETIVIARQIAEALEEAHEKGIVHRDLKPANVKLTPEGKVKVLDFGLAKAWEGPGAASSDLSQSPTLAHTGTQAGIILGTAAYMSPEQARGKPVDKRADIWAFGVVLFEMLAGQRLFAGETVSDTLAAVLKTEPDWTALPAEVPPRTRLLLRRCLERDSRRRIRDMGDVRIELEETGASPGDAPGPAAPPGGRRRLVALTLGAALVVAALAGGSAAGRATRAPGRAVARFKVALTEGHSLSDETWGALAIAADDRAIVFAATDGKAERLYVQLLDRTDAQPIADTENASDPFFSPDGRWVGFFAGGQLKKVSLTDGTVVRLTAADDSTGATWAPDGTIVFAPGYSSSLVRVSADGGATRPVTTRDAAAGESSHVWPDALPDGEHVLYTIEQTGRPFDEASIGVVSLRTGKSKVVLRGGAAARYSTGGHLVYARGSRLLAVPFDLRRLEVSGEATTVVDGVAAEVGRGRTHFAVSRAGSLTFAPGDLNAYPRGLAWATRDGALTPATTWRRAFALSLAPDGDRVLMQVMGADDDLWLLDLARDVPTRLTFGTENRAPAWAADGRRFVWSSDRDGVFNLYLGSLDHATAAERLAPADRVQTVGGWSADGRHIVYIEEDPTTRGDIWMLPMEADRRPQALVKTAFGERVPSLSPDGRWLAYTSDETGRAEVYIQAFPGPGPRRQVSGSRGGDTRSPLRRGSQWARPLRWSRDGRELFYWTGDRLMSVAIRAGRELDSGAPRRVFEMAGVVDFDVAPDGRRFLLTHEIPRAPLRHLVVALGGAAEIGRRTP